jgi:MFS family permease
VPGPVRSAEPAGVNPTEAASRNAVLGARASRTMMAVGFCFNLGYLMLAFLVPLYAVVRLHDSLVSIGVITALPSMLQLPLRTLSGPIGDFWGEARLLRVSFSFAACSGLSVVLFPGLTGLVMAQVAIGFARGLYWIPSQAYLSRLPFDRARSLGALTGYNNMGALGGILFAGPLAFWLGFPAAFGISSACQGACLALAFLLPDLPRVTTARTIGAAVARLPQAAARPVMWLAGAIAGISAIPQGLVQSFYPVYLTHLGLAAPAASAITSLRSGGVIVAGFLSYLAFRRWGQHGSLLGFGLLLALSLAATGATGRLAPVAVFILLAGLASGVLNVLFIVKVSDASAEGDRSTNIAVTEICFALAMMLVPLLFGVVAHAIGLSATFVAAAALVIVVVVALVLAWRPLSAAEAARAAR